MNFTMNLKLLAVALVAFCVSFTPLCQAQPTGPVTVLNGGTNNVAAATTNTYALSYAISEVDNVGVQISLAGTAATPGAHTATFRFSKSMNGTTYETTPSQVFSLTPNGTNVVCLVTNITAPSAALLKLVSVENSNTNTIPLTNITVTLRYKSPKRFSSR
jgi:hypothetical protein